MVSDLEFLFPGLRRSGYHVTSPPTLTYNCVAWAVGDDAHWWWPDPSTDNDAAYWPPHVVREESQVAFAAAFATRGYTPCVGVAVEPGFDRIALFADLGGVPTHVARQLPSGNWTSKLGRLEDVEHPLTAISGELYGEVVQIYKRPIPLDLGHYPVPTP